ncbi:MAG TPA: 30S ribosomal protein S12 methylthiotransferase RimO [Anaerolineae bacterium]|nr:30S ribosomal protein S12 methylthiotransferase RimO [Anaerolineae bacterium]HQI87368.1 30S ribosomal protein S12 methylthiotransferase RimO [Anaerolineae bacterium]
MMKSRTPQHVQRIRGEQRPFRFYIASLGCPKNTVDSSNMAVLLQRAGYAPTLDPDLADIIIVNTCGFIDPARQESLETLQDLAAGLRPDQRLVAAGCWAQRDPEALQTAVPQLNAVIGTRSWNDIVALTDQLLNNRETAVLQLIEDTRVVLPEEADAPGFVISGPSAFLKIADGCSRQCAFCAIPSIKGPNVSRTMAAVIEDARQLQALGVLEVNLIAQDVTYYGHDQGMKDGLAQLLEQMVAAVPDMPWIRLLYAFPGFVTPRLIDIIAQSPQILPYIDIPLQHAHPDVLRRMRRPTDVDGVRRLIEQLRTAIPDVALRTTFIVGFPGETEAEFLTLLDFVNAMRFDRLGVFTYSHENGTAAAQLADDVPIKAKEERYDAIMLAQQTISRRKNFAFVGKRMQVLLEGTGEGVTVGRTYRDAPEIDGLVLIKKKLRPNRFVTVEITDALEYDLIGRIVEEK